ncbi:MAG: HAMP domain-containing histidine kinase [Thermoanaerobaculales bacterium]|nr:HAMP domain-containing histidine kinase [Thermoanaerobaculales bacterium]
MVTRRSPSESSDVSRNEALREVLAEREAEVEALRQQLVELRTAGEDFLSDAAHAIRSPLTVTHSYLEILCSDLRDGLTEEQQSFLGIAYENAAKLRNLVDDLVDLAALETGAAQIELAPAAANTMVETVQSDLLPIAGEKGVELTAELVAGLPEVTVDKGRLQNVLRRLLDNALRFTPEGGSVRLRTRQDQDDVMIEVVDSGVGIPADRVTDAFQAFVQLHRQPGENREGYGLGLPLCRRMVEAVGGTLELTSIEGKGTTVTVRLPVGEIK